MEDGHGWAKEEKLLFAEGLRRSKRQVSFVFPNTNLKNTHQPLSYAVQSQIQIRFSCKTRPQAAQECEPCQNSALLLRHSGSMCRNWVQGADGNRKQEPTFWLNVARVMLKSWMKSAPRKPITSRSHHFWLRLCNHTLLCTKAAALAPQKAIIVPHILLLLRSPVLSIACLNIRLLPLRGSLKSLLVPVRYAER